MPVRLLQKKPCKILIAVLFVALAFCFVVAGPFGTNFTAIGDVISHFRKTADRTGLQHDGKSQDLPDTGNRQKITILEPVAKLLMTVKSNLADFG